MVTLKRMSFLGKGYDCIRQPCGKNGCGTRPGASHGIHCDDWLYSVSDGRVALSLGVFSGNFPDTVPAETRSRVDYPKGSDMSVHASFPTSTEDVRNGHRACELVDGGKCWVVKSWGLLARDTWVALPHANAFEQPDAFWVGLEEAWHRLAKDVHAERGHACEACGGTGFVIDTPTPDPESP